VNLLSAALVPPISYIKWNASDGFSGVKWAAMLLAIYAARSYLNNRTPITANAPQSTIPSTRSWQRGTPMSLYTLIKNRPVAIAFFLILFLPLVFAFMTSPLPPRSHSERFVWNNLSDLAKHPLAPHKPLPSQSSTQECVRRPLPPSSAYVGPGPRPDFHAFDDVLLVSFFSHPRYDVNLDAYREAYSEYFPNVSYRLSLAR
jgi:hypothetical protein